MKVKEVQFDMGAYLSSRFDQSPRSSGLHLSTIYGDMDRRLNPKRYAGGFSECDLRQFASIGFLWERILETTLADMTVSSDPARYYRPGEQEVDGVYCTPDYADLDFLANGSNELGLEEWKVSWESTHKLDDLERNFWRWLVQMKGYCWTLETRFARLRVLSIAGDWKQNIVPVCRVFEFEFTSTELFENWQMLMNHARTKKWL